MPGNVQTVDETLEAPVDVELVKLGGRVYRRPRSEFVDNQLIAELGAIKAEVN